MTQFLPFAGMGKKGEGAGGGHAGAVILEWKSLFTCEIIIYIGKYWCYCVGAAVLERSGCGGWDW
jgi:hypothetical protein